MYVPADSALAPVDKMTPDAEIERTEEPEILVKLNAAPGRESVTVTWELSDADAETCTVPYGSDVTGIFIPVKTTDCVEPIDVPLTVTVMVAVPDLVDVIVALYVPFRLSVTLETVPRLELTVTASPPLVELPLESFTVTVTREVWLPSATTGVVSVNVEVEALPTPSITPKLLESAEERAPSVACRE